MTSSTSGSRVAAYNRSATSWITRHVHQRTLGWSRRLLGVVAAAAAGAVALQAALPFEWTPWNLARNGVLAAALLVFAIRLVASRWEAVATTAGWYVGALASLPFVWSGFFGSGAAWQGWLAYLGLAALLSIPALLSPRGRPALGVLAAIVIAAVPPLGFVGLANPTLLAGAVFPGLGWVGLGLFVAGVALCASRRKIAVLVQLVMLGWGMATLATPPKASPMYAWAATTYFGEGTHGSFAQMYRHIDTARTMTTKALNEGAKLVVLPEGTDPDWGAGERWYWREVAALAGRKQATVLLGVYTDPVFGPASDGFVSLTTGKLYPASVTVPFGMWAPWRANNFPLHLLAPRSIPTVYGPAAYLVCYEELLPWTLERQMVGHKPRLLVSGASQWFGSGWVLRAQRRGVHLLARLWGLPLLRAVNHAPLDP